jgi:hypothetical protein
MVAQTTFHQAFYGVEALLGRTCRARIKDSLAPRPAHPLTHTYLFMTQDLTTQILVFFPTWKPI